jgi:hypothetical protein
MPAEIASGPALASPGVGIPGMHERLDQHQGKLEIKSNNKGTIVTAIVPLSSMHWPQDLVVGVNENKGTKYQTPVRDRLPGRVQKPSGKNT